MKPRPKKAAAKVVPFLMFPLVAIPEELRDLRGRRPGCNLRVAKSGRRVRSHHRVLGRKTLSETGHDLARQRTEPPQERDRLASHLLALVENRGRDLREHGLHGGGAESLHRLGGGPPHIGIRIPDGLDQGECGISGVRTKGPEGVDRPLPGRDILRGQQARPLRGRLPLVSSGGR